MTTIEQKGDFECACKHYIYGNLVFPWYDLAIMSTTRFSAYRRRPLRYTIPPRTEMCHRGGIILHPERVYCGLMYGSGCPDIDVFVQLRGFGGRPRCLCIATWTGCSKSTWAGFSLSTETVSYLPPISIANVSEPG